MKAYGNATDANLCAMVEAFKKNKESRGLDADYAKQLKANLDDFVEFFKDFEAINEKL